MAAINVSHINLAKRLKSNEDDELIEVKSWLMSMSPDEGSVDLWKDSSNEIIVMTLNNPFKKNALTGKMMCQMNDHLKQIMSWSNNNGEDVTSVKVMLLRGAGGFFCSGLDLKLVQKMLDDNSKADGMVKLMGQNTEMLANLQSIVTIAMIEGKALGGGAEIAASCRLRIMASNAELAFVHAKMGITMAFGGGVRLLRSIHPMDQALKILLSGARFGSNHCLKYGVCSHVLVSEKDEERLQEALDWITSEFNLKLLS